MRWEGRIHKLRLKCPCKTIMIPAGMSIFQVSPETMISWDMLSYLKKSNGLFSKRVAFCSCRCIKSVELLDKRAKTFLGNGSRRAGLACKTLASPTCFDLRKIIYAVSKS